MHFSLTSSFEQAIVKKYYESVNSLLDTFKFGEQTFMLNLGYVPIHEIPSFSVVKLPHDFSERQSGQLVLEVIGDCLIDDRDILDVSCGRGGAAFILKTYFHPRSYLGLDICPRAIEYCRQHHVADNIVFQPGDAENLPVKDMSFDVVLNIDSAHHYPNIAAFYREVHRVLRQDGWFLYCVGMPAKKMDINLKLITSIGFEVVTDIDISRNVLLSCDETTEQYLKIFQDNNLFQDESERLSITNFICSPGSERYQAFASGYHQQRIFKFRKVSKKNVGLTDARIALSTTALEVKS